MALVWVMGASPLRAAHIPDLGASGGFAVLGLEGGSISINSATSITGDVGYGRDVTSTVNQKVTTFSGAAIVHSTTDFDYDDKNFQPSGGIHIGTHDALLDQAQADAIAASAAFAALAPTHTEGEIGGPLTNQAALQQGLVVSKGQLNVINLTGIVFNSDTLTLQGGADDRFVFNVSGDVDWSQSQIILSGGVTANHVLFNFPSVSSILINKDSSVWIGTILAPLSGIIYHNPATFTGAIIAKDIDLHSDFNLTEASFEGHAVPLPAALPAGLALLGLAMGVKRGQEARARKERGSP